jgi:hypothetical protein
MELFIDDLITFRDMNLSQLYNFKPDRNIDKGTLLCTTKVLHPQPLLVTAKVKSKTTDSIFFNQGNLLIK